MDKLNGSTDNQIANQKEVLHQQFSDCTAGETSENNKKSRSYIAIDLKSFYASVECVERGLDPLTTNLVVADESRTAKTICLAVSPSLKQYGIPGRARLFEVISKVKDANAMRKQLAPDHVLTDKSYNANALAHNPSLAIDYIVAPPRMQYYMDYSAKIFEIYMRYVAPEDMHVYSVDEVFIDATAYLDTYKMTAHELAMTMIRAVLKETGVTATAGIGTNLYLCKVAMDITAKHMEPDEDGVRIAELDEASYRRQLWSHKPLTDFWRVGPGISKKLMANGLYTMGDICRCSLGGPKDFFNEDLLYKLFGINAELLIDHAWGYEPCTLENIKAYKPENNSLSTGQVLQEPYDCEHAKLIVREMTELLVLDLVKKGLMTNQLVLVIGYDIENLKDPKRAAMYHGEVKEDRYGRRVPKHANGTKNLKQYSSSTRQIVDAVMELFDEIMDATLLVRRLNVVANHVLPEKEAKAAASYEQMDLFDFISADTDKDMDEEALHKERNMQKAILDLQKKFGKNAVLKGMNLKEGATTISRNGQIGGHKA